MSKKYKLILVGFAVSLLLIAGVTIAYAEPAPKVEICHLDADSGTYIKIDISENAFPAHVEHGDGSPGEPIPNMDGYIFGEDCQPLIVYSFILSGITFEDTYADGTKDLSEVDPGLSGWTIKIEIDKGPDGTPINGTATTGDGGSWEWSSPQYAFPVESPPTLTLKICEDLQGGWNQSFPPGNCHDLTFIPNTGTIPQALGPFDFGNWQSVSVTACKQRDFDGNTDTTADQVPVEGWSVSRTEEQVVVDTQPTAADGCYTWENLPPGMIYGVQEEERARWIALGPVEMMFEKAKSGESYSHTFVNKENIPVIVLPGIMGSKLYDRSGCISLPDGEVWVGTPLITWPSMILNDDGITSMFNCNIEPDMDKDVFGTYNTYEVLITQLRSAGYTVNFFPFDWRKDLRDSANDLDDQINDWEYDKVILIGHSMGGLLARTYIENPAYEAKVEKVITVGSPYLGAPTLAPNMRAGMVPRCLDIFGADICVSSVSVFFLIRNSPGIMQLLPSRAYFDRGIPFGLDYYYSYGLFETKLTSLTSTHDFYKTNFGLLGWQNGTLLDRAVEYHDIYDNFSDISVDYYVIAAGNWITPLAFHENCLPLLGCIWEGIAYMYGDETVPLNSATYLGTTSDNVHIRILDSLHNHGDLTSDKRVIPVITEILASPPSVSVQQLSVMADTPPPPYIKLFVLGSTEVSISDGTHTIGLDQNGMIYNDIPGATYQAFGYQTEVILPSDQTYTLTLKQVGEIPLQVKVSELTAPSYDGVFTASYQVVFDAIPLSMDGVATMSLDLAAGLDTLTLSVLNDGQPEQILQPSSVLDLKQ